MLKIINNLNPFFEDCYRRVNVREYGKIIKVSPPTASTLLKDYNKNNLLKKENYKNYMFFYANKDDEQFISLSRIYWYERLKDLLNYLEKELTSPTVILFGSLSKAETTLNSDIDLAIFAQKKYINLKTFDNKFKRKIQIFWFNSINKVENKELTNNIINGYIMKGRLSLWWIGRIVLIKE